MITIAKSAMGFCVCGVGIEVGEAVETSKAGARHIACRDLTAANGLGTSITQTETSGFLFDDLFSDAERTIIENAKATLNVNHISFDGATVLGIDTPRLAGQLARVYSFMIDGRFHSLSEIASVAGGLETSISARVRDLKKKKYGAHKIEKRKVKGQPREYRLVIMEGDHNERAA